MINKDASFLTHSVCTIKHRLESKVDLSTESGDISCVDSLAVLYLSHFVGSSGGKRKFEDDDLSD